MAYLRETVDQYEIEPHIRYGHHVEAASWSSDDARWTITGTAGQDPFTVEAKFVLMCAGYYSYRHGHQVDFAGQDDFIGRIVRPQEWPRDLDYSGKRVAVIGSGATAMTLVPAMAADAAHVTMIQRSPTYVISRPAKDAIANGLRKILPGRLAYALTRAKNVKLQDQLYRRSRTAPDKIRKYLLKMATKEIGAEQVEAHFSPSYGPWEQRLCLVPDSDLFVAIRDGRASVTTGEIERFTASGVKMRSGEEIEADIIVTATGLEVVAAGEMAFSVDGAAVDFADSWSYLGVAYTDVPNLMSTFGYINASWTLRADLISEFFCRVLNHLRRTGTEVFVPRLRPSDRAMEARPWIEDFSAGYIQRALHLMPKQGDRLPWLNPQRYSTDKKMFRRYPLTDGALQFRP